MKHRPQPFPPVRNRNTPEMRELLRRDAERIAQKPALFGIEPWKDVRLIVYANFCDAVSWAEVCAAVPDCELN